MKAIVYEQYGAPEVLQLKEVSRPAIKDDEVLLKVFASSINYGDLLARNFGNTPPDKMNMPFFFWFMAKIFFGFRKPKIKILGNEFSGEVVETGRNVSLFRTGDKVFGYRAMNMGTYAEYVSMPQNGCISLKPENISFEEAAVLPYGSLTALNILKKMKIEPEQKVLVIGASGSIGSAAVQVAKYYGAKVTGVCGTERVEFVNSIGAEKTIDYTKEDFTKSGDKFDLVIDILGKYSYSQLKNLLTVNGRILYISFKTKKLLQMIFTRFTGSKKVICGIAPVLIEDLLEVKRLAEEGKIRTIIDKKYPFENAAEAHRYIESGNRKANVVLTFLHT